MKFTNSNPNDEFLKELIKEFYHELINTNDFNDIPVDENIFGQINKNADFFINKNKALKMYLSAIKRDEFQNINALIAKYLLALFYYKDIILDKRISINYSHNFEGSKTVTNREKILNANDFNQTKEKVEVIENEDSDALYLLGLNTNMGWE